MKQMSDRDYQQAVRFLRMFSKDETPTGTRGANARRLAGCLVRKLERKDGRGAKK